MSGDLTRRMPAPYPPSRTVRRRRRWPFALLVTIAVVLAALVLADRAAASYAGGQVAQQLQRHGFPGRPQVTIEGFPFLTQLAGRDVRDVHITASSLREGAATASLVADATGVRLAPDYQSGVVTRVHGRVLMGFASVARIARHAGVPVMAAWPGGRGRLDFKINLGVVTTTVITSIRQVGAHTFQVHLISAGGLPLAELGNVSNLEFQLPALPYGIAIHDVRVTGAGVAGDLTAHNLYFRR